MKYGHVKNCHLCFSGCNRYPVSLVYHLNICKACCSVGSCNLFSFFIHDTGCDKYCTLLHELTYYRSKRFYRKFHC